MTLLLIYLAGALLYWLGMAYIDGRNGEAPLVATSDPHLTIRIIATLLWPLAIPHALYVVAHHLGTKSRKT